MQNFIVQANKNGVTLLNAGKCQFCGADYKKGIFDCMDNYSNGLEPLDFNNPDYHISRFLSVGAHALQHPEIHGRWSNHFHLTRLNLILEKKQYWGYKKSPQLSDYLNEYKPVVRLKNKSISDVIKRSVGYHIEVLQASKATNFTCYSGEESSKAFGKIFLDLKLIAELREGCFNSLSDFTMCRTPLRWPHLIFSQWSDQFDGELFE